MQFTYFGVATGFLWRLAGFMVVKICPMRYSSPQYEFLVELIPKTAYFFIKMLFSLRFTMTDYYTIG